MVYSPHCLCKTETITFDFITLSTRFVNYFPWITQSIKGINKKAWQIISMICKIYSTTTMNLKDITSPRWGYLIWSDHILGSHSGDFNQKFFWKVKCPTYAQGAPSPLELNIDRCTIASKHFGIDFCILWRKTGNYGLYQPYWAIPF